MIDNDTRVGRMDRTAEGGRDALLLAARVLLGAIFVQSGFGKLMALGGFIAGLESQGVPMAAVAGTVGAVVECFGGLAVVLGAWTRLAALLVAGFTVAATLIAHRYWDAAPEAMKMQQIQFMKNLAIIGGYLALVASGAGRFSVDGFRGPRR
ncbi:putative oxidoreductase [Azospirillum agricola]|uniref:DoxX family protein n=1 Tax=Azospirillum agricola TaxID=1720247 RepID=UPI001AEB4D97|nr:DoxX family protein [Azospirillum agricola]MBP2228491.1 putative oxidoreductase [Azospirillum agricola]